jgi:hypothetical protein
MIAIRLKDLAIFLRMIINEVGNDKMSLEKLVMIVIWCVQEDPSLRPTMKEVLLMLEGVVEVFVPPSPYLYGSVSCN